MPSDVEAIRRKIREFFNTPIENNRTLGGCRWGVYAFLDYDDEPIYVGQTREGVRSRIGRHLTNQRTDAVAMSVLDPFEVCKIRVWVFDLAELAVPAQKAFLDRAEYTVYQLMLAESKLKAVLNEKVPAPTDPIDLPAYREARIIPDDIYPARKHPDTRIARRANTIATLARVISERKVSRGLRNTLLTQARRLERLALERLEDFPEGQAGETDTED